MLSTTQKNKLTQMTNDELNNVFLKACQTNNIEKAEYILSCPSLVSSIDISRSAYTAFKRACLNNYQEIVFAIFKAQFVNKDHENQNDIMIHYVLYSGLYDLTKAIFTSQLFSPPNLEKEQCFGFLEACKKFPDIVNFLIFDHNLPLTEYLEKRLQEKKLYSIINMFHTQELKEKISLSLNKYKENSSLTTAKIVKI